ncbi:neuropeptide-like protein 31 [Artemia franciscana]|uniref:neuropeptide-like protein 31 n=1 Tax=Artemia franciscana TaxID=6661 RepID=UPI0032DBD8B3
MLKALIFVSFFTIFVFSVAYAQDTIFDEDYTDEDAQSRFFLGGFRRGFGGYGFRRYGGYGYRRPYGGYGGYGYRPYGYGRPFFG